MSANAFVHLGKRLEGMNIYLQSVHYRGQGDDDESWTPKDLNKVPYVYVQFTTSKGGKSQMVQMNVAFLGKSVDEDNKPEFTELKRLFPHADVIRSKYNILVTLRAPTGQEIATPAELEQTLLEVYGKRRKLTLTRREKDGDVWYKIGS